jgi:lipid-A-disaccharide synthase
MLTLFPFEADFYRRSKIPVHFVGHPLADQFEMQADVNKARLRLGIESDRTVLAVLPGSRRSEVELLGPVFMDVIERIVQRYPNIIVLIPAANAGRRRQLEQQLVDRQFKVRLLDGQSRAAMEAADLVLLASGTSSLEAMFLKKPMVVAYKLGNVTYHLVRKLVKSKFIALPNLLADRQVVKEFIQKDAVPEKIADEVVRLLENPRLGEEMSAVFGELHVSLKLNASELAATHVLDLIESRQGRR